MIKITEKPIDVQKVIDTASSLNAGAVNVFVGTVRNNAHGKNVVWLVEHYREGRMKLAILIVNIKKSLLRLPAMFNGVTCLRC